MAYNMVLDYLFSPISFFCSLITTLQPYIKTTFSSKMWHHLSHLRAFAHALPLAAKLFSIHLSSPTPILTSSLREKHVSFTDSP